MGYTHYWKNREFTADEWVTLTGAARKLFALAKRQGITLADWSGEKGQPEILADRISFNGSGADSHESFTLTRAASGFEFCKTAYKPYDAVAVALLVIAARTGALTWSSDGGASDHEAGKLLGGQAARTRKQRDMAATLAALPAYARAKPGSD